MPIYDMKKLKSPDLYEMYLSGSKSFITIENPSLLSDKELVIFNIIKGTSKKCYVSSDLSLSTFLLNLNFENHPFLISLLSIKLF